MKNSDLTISNRDRSYRIRVSGRANFEYAVPLRELARTLDSFQGFRIDLAACTAMDSTFMGVLTMIGLKGRKQNVPVELLNASDVLKKLLTDLGVAKLFVFTVNSDAAAAVAGTDGDKTDRPDQLTMAETVAEAHKTLAQADGSNAERFKDVIRYAEDDVERLRKQQK